MSDVLSSFIVEGKLDAIVGKVVTLVDVALLAII